MAPSASSYGSDSKWTDVIPIPQDDGGAHPLAAIAYSDEYSEAMSYLRAVMAQNEYSERALSLTEHIIGMNPAHYTIWFDPELPFPHNTHRTDQISTSTQALPRQDPPRA